MVFRHVVQVITLAQYEENFTTLNAAGQARTNNEQVSKYAVENKILELYSAQEDWISLAVDIQKKQDKKSALGI